MGTLSTIFIVLFLLVSLVTNVVLGWYLFKFIKIIMTFEDDLADAQEALKTVETALGKLEEIKMFYEDDTIKDFVSEVLDYVKIARHYVNWMSKRFTDRSKQRYVTVEPTEEEVQLMLQPQPDEQEEGTVLHVGH